MRREAQAASAVLAESVALLALLLPADALADALDDALADADALAAAHALAAADALAAALAAALADRVLVLKTVDILKYLKTVDSGGAVMSTARQMRASRSTWLDWEPWVDSTRSADDARP